MNTPTPTYDLWCVDKGDPHDEHNYYMPFDTKEEAQKRLDAWLKELRAYENEEGPDPRAQKAGLRRCRRARWLDFDRRFRELAFDNLVEGVDERAGEEGNENWLAQWDDEVATSVEGAEGAFDAWAQEYFKFDIFIVEPEA